MSIWLTLLLLFQLTAIIRRWYNPLLRYSHALFRVLKLRYNSGPLMYTPKHFLESDRAKLTALIHENAFGTLVSVINGRATVSHIPFIYDDDKSILLAHVARANPQWQELPKAQDVLVIFQGPHAYVSPSWYHQPGVPTWNYAIVHIRGHAEAFEDSRSLQSVVERLTKKYESSNEPPWSASYDAQMLKQIVGIKIHINEIKGKFKLSQNRTAEDRNSVISRLKAAGTTGARGIAEMMEKYEY